MLEYVTEFRRLATHCEFGTFLQDALRNRLVCGTTKTLLLKRIFYRKKNLMLEKVIRVAQSLEAANKKRQEVEGRGSGVHTNSPNWSLPQR